MNTMLARLALASALVMISHAAIGQTAEPQPAPQQPEEQPVVDEHADDPTAVLGFTMNDIEGEAKPLDEYGGKVVLVVNVASQCGLTPQYEALEALYREHKDRGLVVLGFPANNFGEQEPGTDAEILEFCTGRYDVTFPMFSKINVVGDDPHPLYAKLAKAMEDQGGEPNWNFTKYLVDRTGHVVKRFGPKAKPDDPEVITEIERLLAEPAPAPAPAQEKKPS